MLFLCRCAWVVWCCWGRWGRWTYEGLFPLWWRVWSRLVITCQCFGWGVVSWHGFLAWFLGVVSWHGFLAWFLGVVSWCGFLVWFLGVVSWWPQGVVCCPEGPVFPTNNWVGGCLSTAIVSWITPQASRGRLLVGWRHDVSPSAGGEHLTSGLSLWLSMPLCFSHPLHGLSGSLLGQQEGEAWPRKWADVVESKCPPLQFHTMHTCGCPRNAPNNVQRVKLS